MKNIRIFYLKIFVFVGKIFNIYLNRHVFVIVSDPSVTSFVCHYVPCNQVIEMQTVVCLENQPRIKMLFNSEIELPTCQSCKSTCTYSYAFIRFTNCIIGQKCLVHTRN